MVQANLKIQPFINLLRKSGLQVSIDSAILGQQILNVGYFSSNKHKLRQALKSIIIKRYEEDQIFDVCFDIYFSNKTPLTDQLQLVASDQSNSSNNMDPEGGISSEFTTEGRTSEFLDQMGDHRSDIASELQLNNLSGNIGGDSNDGTYSDQAISLYTRWLPSEIQNIAYSFLTQPETNWQPIIGEFADILFGFGQYRHVQTIAQRFTRYASFLTRGFNQLRDQARENENLSGRIRFLEELEFLRQRIIEFLAKVRISLLRNSDMDSDALLRQFYSANFIPDLNDFQQDFKRIEGDNEKVQQHLLYLGKKLAVQEKRKRIRAQRGKINFRRTIRKNISNGGHILALSRQKKQIKDPKIILLSDVSGSTDWISEFFFIITYAAQSTFKKLRLFEFDNTTVEITKGLASPTLPQALQKRIESWQTTLRTRTIHSNYNTSLIDFELLAKKYFSTHTSILILGDCRDWMGGYKQTNSGNYEPESKDVLKRIIAKNKRVIILNPENPDRWDTGDSIVQHFSNVGAQVVYVENIVHLMNFIFKHKWY